MRAALLLAALVLAGCASERSVGFALGNAEEDGLRLRAEASPAEIVPGQMVEMTVDAANEGAPVRYVAGGCGSAPWRFDIVAPNGTRIGPMDPDPRCLGPPDEERALATGETLQARLVWNGTRGWRDDALEVHREPVPPGAYELRASIELARAGETFAPTVALQVRVG